MGLLTNARVNDALLGMHGDDQKRIAETGVSWLELLLAKNADYGCAVWNAPVLAPKVDAGTAILVRMSDKVDRLRTLLGKSGAPEVEEPIEDTLKDLGAYALLYLARPKK